jgi:hypothetical protein
MDDGLEFQVAEDGTVTGLWVANAVAFPRVEADK